MQRTPFQSTRFNGVLERMGSGLLNWISSSWLEKSVGLLGLFSGAYAAANVTSLYLSLLKVQSLGALGLLLFFEAIIRLKQRYAGTSQGWPACPRQFPHRLRLSDRARSLQTGQ